MSHEGAARPKLDDLYAEVAEALKVSEQAEETKKQLVVTRAEIAAEEERLSAISTQVKHASADYSKQTEAQTAQLSQIKGDIDSANKLLKEIQKQQFSANELLIESKEQLVKVNIAIADAKTARQQIVNDNAHILVDYQEKQQQAEAKMSDTQSQIKRLITELEQQAHTRDTNEAQIEGQRSSITAQDSAYNAKVAQYKLDLGALEIEIGNKKTLLVSFDSNMDHRKRELDTKEESINIRAATLVQRAQDLDNKERKLKRDYTISGLSYD